jgi:HK97 family phage major capsid protein
MKTTPALKDWLVDNTELAAEATDDEVKLAVADALFSETLTKDKYQELTEDKEANALKGQLDDIQKLLQQQRADILKQAEESKAPFKTPSSLEKKFAEADEKKPDDGKPDIKVKGPKDWYDSTTKAAVYPSQLKSGRLHPRAGMPVIEGGGGVEGIGARQLEHPSELSRAICGAYMKRVFNQQLKGSVPPWLTMNDHDRELVKYAVANCKWAGVLHGAGTEEESAIGVRNRMLTPSEQKAILDDTTSDGQEIAPIEFDAAVILTPLLYGEFFPWVRVVPVTRGRRIEGASLGTVTLTASTEGAAIGLFNTASFVTAFDTTIFVCAGAIEVGLDFLSDSPIPVMDILQQQYGEVLMAWLDEQISVGDGTTEPEGVTVATGPTAVTATNGNTGPPTVNDYMNLIAGVTKPYKKAQPPGSIRFGANETSYYRARRINVGTADARLVFGMDPESYMLFDRDYGVDDNFANTQIVFGCFYRYRMYRRLGLTLKATTEGRTLTRANEVMLVARARFGGQVEDGSGFARIANAQS